MVLPEPTPDMTPDGASAGSEPSAAARLTKALDIACLYAGGMTFGEFNDGSIIFGDIRDVISERRALYEAMFAIRNQLEAAKSSLMYNNRWLNAAGYITDAALWIERAISAAEQGLSEAHTLADAAPQARTADPRQTEPREAS